MRALQILSILFTLSAVAGMLLIGYSYISIAGESISLAAGSAFMIMALLFWFAALRESAKSVAKNRQITLGALNPIQVMCRLPALLQPMNAGGKVKGVDRSLPYAVIFLFILLPVSMLVLPSTATTVLLALVLGMSRLLRQLKKGVATLEPQAADRDASTREPCVHLSCRTLFEALGNIMLLGLIAFLLAVAFNALYVVPFEGYRARIEKRALEDQLSRAYGAAASYLRTHPGMKVATMAQLGEGGWRETFRVRFVQSDLSEKGGTITLEYAGSPRSRHEPVTGRIVSDGQTVRIEMLPR